MLQSPGPRCHLLFMSESKQAASIRSPCAALSMHIVLQGAGGLAASGGLR